MEIVHCVDGEEETVIREIEHEMRKIYLSVEKLYNNASLSETNDPLEKCLINNYYYSSFLLERGLADDLGREADILKSFADGLQVELDYLTSDMDNLIMKMNAYKDQINRINRNITGLHEMMEAQKNEKKSDKNWDRIMKNIKMRFRKEKSNLKTIIFSLFPDSCEIHDLIARIIEHHFTEGSDKYIQLEDSDNVTEQIELLRRTRLFETNPNNPLEIRLVNLV